MSVIKRIITLPITVAADVVTMGGAMTDRREPYTVEQLRKLLDEVTK